MVSHREVHENERLLDVLTVESEGRDSHEVYFDVSSCFVGRRPTPPCPYCGEPLVTAKAKQCRHCFADFHDPAHVIYRKGSDHVDRVRENAARRKEAEASASWLNDPCAVFNSVFRSTQATADVFVLRFPDQVSVPHERVFRIGVERLITEGCRGVVCHVDQPGRQIAHTTSIEAGEQLGLLFKRITQFPRFGVCVVLVGGEGLTSMRGVPSILENCGTEELAVARLTSELRARDDSDV